MGISVLTSVASEPADHWAYQPPVAAELAGDGHPVDVLLAVDHRLQLLGVDIGGRGLMLDHLGEGLARHVHAFIDRIAGRAPGFETAFLNSRIRRIAS